MLILAGQSLKEVLLSPNFLQISETQTFTVHSNERIEQKYGLYMGHFLQGGNSSCFEPFSLNKKESYISRSLAVATTLIMQKVDDDEDEEENGEANYLPPPIEECSQPGNLCPPPSPPPPPYLPLLTLSSNP